MTQRGFAVAAFRDAGDLAQAGAVDDAVPGSAQWRMELMPPALLVDLGMLLQALRSQPPEGGPFVVASVDGEFFVIARQLGRRVLLLLSDMTASVEYPLAEQALTRLGEDPPDDEELDEVWPIGDLDLFADLDLSEEEMEEILDDLDSDPDEILEAIIDRVGLGDQFGQATAAARVVR
ncbi:MAG: tRNA adenosine deaminase-associated protein [Sciscionella sp.]